MVDQIRSTGSSAVGGKAATPLRLHAALTSIFFAGAMSRAHREIIHMARLLGQLTDGLTPGDADRYLIRDAQRVIESIEALVRIHNAQEEDIYEHAISGPIAQQR